MGAWVNRYTQSVPVTEKAEPDSNDGVPISQSPAESLVTVTAVEWLVITSPKSIVSGATDAPAAAGSTTAATTINATPSAARPRKIFPRSMTTCKRAAITFIGCKPGSP